MRTAKEIIQKSEFNEYCVCLYAMHGWRRGQKQSLKDCIGRYDAQIIINTPPAVINQIFKEMLAKEKAAV